MSRTVMMFLDCPWKDKYGEVQISRMRLTGDCLTRRYVTRYLRKWYKVKLDFKVPKFVIQSIWSNRFVTNVLSEEEIQTALHEMAMEAHEQIKNDTDTEAQETTNGGAG